MRKKILIAAAIALVVFEFLFLGVLGPVFTDKSGGRAIPDMESLTAQELQTWIGEWSGEMRATYRNIQILDFIFPLVYGTFFFLALMAVSGNRLWFALVAPAGVLADYAENITTRVLLWQDSPVSLALCQAKVLFSTLKFGFLGLAFLLLIAGAAGMFLRRILSRKRKT